MIAAIGRRSIFRTLILSFILILSPIYILSMVIYQTGMTTLRQEISSSMLSQVTFYMDNLERDIQRIQSLQYNMVNDKDINKLAVLPQMLDNIGTMEAILRIQDRLNSIKNSSPYIANAFAFIPSVNKTISALTVSDFEANTFESMLLAVMEEDRNVYQINGRYFLIIPYPFSSVSGTRKPVFILATELSGQRIGDTISPLRKNPDEGVLLYNDLDQAHIATAYAAELSAEHQGTVLNDSIEQSLSTKTLTIDTRRYLAASRSSEFLGWTLYQYVPENTIFEAVKKFSTWFILLPVSALVIILLYSMNMYSFIHKPLSHLAYSFKQVEKGDFDIHIEHKRDDEFRYIYRRFNDMIENIKNLIDQVYKQKILVQKAAMKQLQSQINPHFLYNSFFIMKTMSQIGDYESLELFMDQLGKYYQFVTRSAANEVTLIKETDHARVYTDIQAMRFSNRLKVIFEPLPAEFESLMVPRLILQPLIENALEHGLSAKQANGLLFIRFVRGLGQLFIEVEDNGDDLTDETHTRLQNSLEAGEGEGGEITALQNIHQRIRLSFGHKSGLSAQRGASGGLLISIRVTTEQAPESLEGEES